MAENETEEGVEVELIAQARALHPYVPTPSDEDQSLVFLSFQKGDMIDVIEMHESGWWEGCCNDTIGLFPGSYVEVVERFLSSKDGATTQSESDDRKEEKKDEAAAAAAAAAAPAAEAKVEESKPAEEEKKQAEPEKKDDAAAPAEDPTAALFQARRFALHFKALLDSQLAEAKTKNENYEKLVAENETLRGEKGAKDARVKELEEELSKKESSAAPAAVAVAVSAGSEGDSKKTEELASEVEALKKSETDLKAEIATLQSQVEEAKKGEEEAKKKAEEAAAAAPAAAATPAAEAAAPVVDNAKVEELEGQVSKLTEEVKEKSDEIVNLQKQVEEAKAAAPAADGEAAAPAPAAEGNTEAMDALNAELKLAKQQRLDLQTKVDEMDMELRNAMDRANDLQKQLDEKPAEAPAAEANTEAVDALNAELKLAKQQRMDLQKKVDEMDMELRNAMDRANDLQKQLDSGVTTGELGDEQVLQAELKMAKQQRMALQTKVDEMDFELRRALDDANEANTLKQKLEEAEKKLEAVGGGEGGGGEAAGPSQAEFDEEKTKRTRFENQCKELKKELEDAKKAGGSTSIMQIKMQAMEKEVAKARKALESATAGPAQQIEELTTETKDQKMKIKKLESELEVALNRASANEEAQKQKLELRKELEEMREAMNKGKDMTEEVKKTPTYKLEKLERENAELKEKLAAHMSGANTPVGSPMVKRAQKKPSPANSPRSSGAAPAAAASLEADTVKIKELETMVEEQKKKISELEATSKDGATPRKLVGSGIQSELQQELNEAQLQIAKKDRELSQLQSQLQETTLQLSRAGMDASAGVGGVAPAKGPAKGPYKGPMKKFVKKKFVKGPVAPKKVP